MKELIESLWFELVIEPQLVSYAFIQYNFVEINRKLLQARFACLSYTR